MKYRVVQWNTGNVGKQTALAIIKNPMLDLVGCYAWSDEKAGSDVGNLLGLDAMGIRATHSIDEVLAWAKQKGTAIKAMQAMRKGTCRGSKSGD